MRFLTIVFILSVAIPSYSLTSTTHSCRILIQFEKVNGERQEVKFSSDMKSKEACQTLAKIHQKNFDPDKIRTKRVSFFWKKVTKSIPMLAKAPPKKQKKTRRNRIKTL